MAVRVVRLLLVVLITAAAPFVAADAALAVTARASVGSGVAARIEPGVVDVDSTLGYEDAREVGTGMVLAANGVVLSNNHVIRGATRISVTDLANGRTYSATVVGYDVSADVAVLRLAGASDLRSLDLASSAGVKVGNAVTAIGNAGGIGGTPAVSVGAVRALDQSITANDELGGAERLHGLIEMDATLEPGDSGGPLVDAAGQVIGMDTAASSSFVIQQGGDVGYAIPSNAARAVVRAIEEGQASSTVHIGPTAFLGVGVESAGYFSGGGYISGALVTSVDTNSPAAHSGLVSGDVITSLAGRSITNSAAYTGVLIDERPGASLKVGWIDQFDVRHHVSVRLGSGPPL